MRPSVAAVIALGRLPAESVDDLEVWLRFEQALGALPERCLDEEALVFGGTISQASPDSSFAADDSFVTVVLAGGLAGGSTDVRE